MKKILILALTFIFTSCATIVNDANVPVSLSFSNGEKGTCNLSNKEFPYKLQYQAHQWLEDQMMH